MVTKLCPQTTMPGQPNPRKFDKLFWFLDLQLIVATHVFLNEVIQPIFIQMVWLHLSIWALSKPLIFTIGTANSVYKVRCVSQRSELKSLTSYEAIG